MFKRCWYFLVLLVAVGTTPPFHLAYVDLRLVVPVIFLNLTDLVGEPRTKPYFPLDSLPMALKLPQYLD